MNFKFDILFTVNFRHQYFDDALFNGLSVQPSNDTIEFFKRYGLVFKAQIGGFLIGYDTNFSGRQRNRDEVLKEMTVLTFRVNLVDLNFYNYTDLKYTENKPSDISDSIFLFSNGSVNISNGTGGELLQKDVFVSEKDLVNAETFKDIYFSKPFGQIDIQLSKDMGTSFEIRFASKTTHWQYVLLSEHLLELQKPAIINKTTQQAFLGPFTVSLPNSRQAIAFVSENPIIITNKPNRMFHLVENYEPGIDRYKVVIDVLPNPDVTMISDIKIGEETITKKNYLNIIL